MPSQRYIQANTYAEWQIEVDGTRLTHQELPNGPVVAQAFATPVDAARVAQRLVERRETDGFLLAWGPHDAPPPVVEPRAPDLESSIGAHLDDPAAYGVYADWLQSQGDPRGELIILQVGRQTLAGETDWRRAERIRFLHTLHAERWLGPLAVLSCRGASKRRTSAARGRRPAAA